MIKKPDLIKPKVGGDVDIWGDKLNANIDKQNQFYSELETDSANIHTELNKLDEEKLSKVDLEPFIENKVDNYIDTNAKPEIDRYVNEVSKPSLDAYEETKERELDNYVDTVNKPQLNKHTELKKGELDNYTTNKESELDEHTGVKKSELDKYIAKSKKPELDEYTYNKEAELTQFTDGKKAELTQFTESQKSEINQFTLEKKNELDAHKQSKEDEIDSHVESKKGELDRYEKSKEVELNTYTSSKKEDIDTHTTAKLSDLDSWTQEKKDSINTYTTTKKQEIHDVVETGKRDITAHTDNEIDRIQNTIGDVATVGYVNQKIEDLVNGSEESLDTLKELADALGNDPNFATTVLNKISTKLDSGTYIGTAQDLKNEVDTKVSKDTKLLLGNGLTGGGTLGSPNTINIQTENESIIVGDKGIKVNVIDDTNNSSTIKPASANAVKLVNDNANGRVSKNGDVINGALAISNGYSYRCKKSDGTSIWALGMLSDNKFYLGENGYPMLIRGSELKLNGNKIYHSGDKPTPNEIGAIPNRVSKDSSVSISGGDGAVAFYPYYSSNSSTYIQGGKTDRTGGFIRITGISDTYLDGVLIKTKDNKGLKVNNFTVYNEGFKPTASDVGALAVKGVADSVGRGVNMTFEKSNELNFDTPSTGLWFGYYNNSGAKITEYRFGNGQKTSDGVNVISNKFSSSYVDTTNLKTNSCKINGGDIDFILPNTSGGHARGIEYYSHDNTKRMAGIGEFGSGLDKIECISIGFGESFWNLQEGGLKVERNILRHGVNAKWRVYSEGFKPTLNDIEPEINIDKRVSITERKWTDLGIKLGTGTYVGQIFVDNSGAGGGQWSEYYGCIFSSYSGGTNSNVVTEIPLTSAGHAPNDAFICLGFKRTEGNQGTQTLVITSNRSVSESLYRFKFRRILGGF